MAAFLLALIAAVAVQTTGNPDYSMKMRELHRRKLPEYIRLLRLPATQRLPYDYEQLVLWVANSRDSRAIPAMIDVMSDTMPRNTGNALMTAAEFLGRMGDKRAIPVLKKNLILERRYGPGAESTSRTPTWNKAVHVGAAAALFELGELQAALPVFRSTLSAGDSNLLDVPSNAFRIVGTSIDAYRERPKALDTIYEYFRAATESKNPELRAGAAQRLVGIDTELAFRVASEVLAIIQPKHDEDIHRWYLISGARRKAVGVLKAIGDAPARLLLQTLVSDQEKSVRIAAEYALRELETKKPASEKKGKQK